ncbi:MAG: hypothetical protein ACYDAN_06035 [Candidatus Limnocylindrales bacterium]
MRTLALTCEALARPVYLSAARSPHVVDVRLNVRGLHDRPSGLREVLQAAIDATGDPVGVGNPDSRSDHPGTIG